MDVITTHLNADFDSMASMVAAAKLYPGAVMVFPGSQERNLRDFFLKSSLATFPFLRVRDVDLKDVGRLILVDIKIPGRLGPLDAVARRPGVELHVWDHHPRTDQDYKAAFERIDPVGATVTLLVEEIRRRRIRITAEEATVLALGLYEDTGSLTFASTTPRDLAAASWLLSRGAHLEIIPAFITREMNAQQVQILNDLLGSLTVHDVHGLPVAIATASTEEYVGELALLAHKIVDMENLDVLFVLARMEDRVILVARSRLPEVDVARVAEALGGGGHPTAASASVREYTLVQVQDKVMAQLDRMVRDRVRARAIMSAPVITIAASEPLSRAAEIMSRLNINSLPVVGRGKKPLGIITRGVVERGILHGLGKSPVTEYMLTDFASVREDAPLEKVQEIIVEKRQRLLPVLEGGRLKGVITRTDLLEAMHADIKRSKGFEEPASARAAGDQPQAVRNVAELMKEMIDRRTMKILAVAGQVADSMGYKAYLVGGLVRDVILRRRNLDVDVVVEGDGIEYARRLARRLRGRARSHRKFKTAVIVLRDGFKIDIATARTEYYESPGSHPMVERGSIKLDLYRRDFSINALAVRLNPDGFGQVVDFFGGQRDIKDRTVRILHNLSFVEDPTRILRAVRFEQSFGFSLGKHTEYLLRGAVAKGYVRRAQGPRLFAEFLAILRSTQPQSSMDRMENLGILKAISPSLNFDARTREAFEQVGRVVSWFQYLFLGEQPDPARVFFSTLMMLRREPERDRIFKVFSLPTGAAAEWGRRWASIAQTLRALAKVEGRSNSWIARTLAHLDTESLLTVMALTKRESTARAVSLYLSRLRHVQREIDGKALRRMGYSSGPVYRSILQSVLDARLDGLVNSLEEERKWVAEHFPVVHEGNSKKS